MTVLFEAHYPQFVTFVPLRTECAMGNMTGTVLLVKWKYIFPFNGPWYFIDK